MTDSSSNVLVINKEVIDSLRGGSSNSHQTSFFAASVVEQFRAYYIAQGGANASYYNVVTSTGEQVDTTGPEITLDGNNPYLIEAGVTYIDPGSSASDDVDGSVSVSNNSNITVDTSTPGNYTVTYTATDAANNSSQKTRTVTVQDTTPPSISLTGGAVDVTVNQPYSEPGVSATDIVDGIVSVSDDSDQVNTSVVGQYTITYTATDAANNSSQTTRTVNVVPVNDNTPPTISLQGENPYTTEAGVAYSDPGASATDAVDGSVSVSNNSGSAVNINTPGTYTVTYTATDAANNSSQTTRTVYVQDRTLPVINLDGNNPYIIEAGVTYIDPGSSATDTFDGSVSVSNNSGATVDTSTPGDYTVTYTATDAAGNTTTRTRTVTVQDTTGPEINLTNPGAITITAGTTYEDPGATATDIVDGAVNVSNNSNLIDINTPDTYTVTYTATDATGNTTTAQRSVTVEAAVVEVQAVSLRYTVYNSSNPIDQPVDRFTNPYVPGAQPHDITNTNVIHIEAKLNNGETGIDNCITSWDINFGSPVSVDDGTSGTYYQPHNFNRYLIAGGGFNTAKYNNMTEGNADGTLRGQGVTPYYSMFAGVGGTNKLYAYTTDSLGDNIVISAPADPSQWFTLCYGRANDSGGTLPLPTTATVLVSPKDGNYGASDITTVSITNIPSA
jgi:hypothetical protein